MRAIGKNIIIEVVNEQVKTQSGLILSSSDKNEDRYRKGIVLHVGDEVNGINDFDVIYYDISRSFSINISGKNYTVIQERDIIIVDTDDNS